MLAAAIEQQLHAQADTHQRYLALMHGLLKRRDPAPLTQAANAVVKRANARQNELGRTVQLIWRADDARLATHVLDHIDDRSQIAAAIVDH